MKFKNFPDPRWFQRAILVSYAVVAREIFHFERSHWITLACVAWGILLDMGYGRLLYRRVKPPISAAIISLACSLLLDSPLLWVYLAAVTLAISSKALITWQGRHYFNPANFGVVVVLVLGADYATGSPALWGGAWLPSLIFGILGLFTAWTAGQLDISLCWLAGFAVLAGLRAWFLHQDLGLLLAIVSAPSFLLFTFHMITDPATSPRGRSRRVVYALAIALVDAAFWVLNVPYGNFYALFMVSAFLPWIRQAGQPEPEVRNPARKERERAGLAGGA